MGIASGLLALTLLGADGTPGPETAQIKYQFRLLEMDGLDWRKAVYTQLQPVARQGGVTVWTAGGDVVKPLVAGASRVIQAPQVTASATSPVVHVNQHSNLRYVAQLIRHADGPKDHASVLAYEPKVDGVREGFSASLTGRKLDQGVLVQLVLDESRCTTMHSVSLAEAFEPRGDSPAKKGKLVSMLQVPETSHTEVAGEWLIPTDGALVMSLGVYTVSDAKEKAAVRERLAILEARPIDTFELKVTRTNYTPAAPVPIAPAPAWEAFAPPMPIAMPVPAMPSRSLPQGVAADGSPVPLPPLPESSSTPSSLPGSSEPCASPQVPHRPEAKVDTGSRAAAFNPEGFDSKYAPAQVGEAKADAPKPPAPTASRPFTFRIPLNAGVTIELRASVKPLTGP